MEFGPNSVGKRALATITAIVDPTLHDFGDQDEGNNDYECGESRAARTFAKRGSSATSRTDHRWPETGSGTGSTSLTNRMNKPDGGDFQHISRFFLDLSQIATGVI